MVECENCHKPVNRRVTYRSGDEEKKVCRDCESKLSAEAYSALCDMILGRDKKSE